MWAGVRPRFRKWVLREKACVSVSVYPLTTFSFYFLLAGDKRFKSLRGLWSHKVEGTWAPESLCGELPTDQKLLLHETTEIWGLVFLHIWPSYPNWNIEGGKQIWACFMWSPKCISWPKYLPYLPDWAISSHKPTVNGQTCHSWICSKDRAGGTEDSSQKVILKYFEPCQHNWIKWIASQRVSLRGTVLPWYACF